MTNVTYDEDTPRATLAGKSWPVPELALRQLRKVRRPLIDLTEALAETADVTTGERVMRLSTEQYEAMCEIVYQGLTRAHPDFTRDAFLDMACTDVELFLAFLLVRRQSGIFVVTDAKEASKPGEDPASPLASRTGTG